ncbi:MAG: hypothetical protein EXS36_01145 [Pedosphaera sp.]|nr:hypothetical protein [Pedosphaera sp.]
MPISLNEDIAGRLDEVGRILAEQGANRFRVQAYHRAAAGLRELARPVSEIHAEQGLPGFGAKRLTGTPIGAHSKTGAIWVGAERFCRPACG